MIEGSDAATVIFKIVIMQFVLPAVISFGISELMRNKGLIKEGDMALEL
jgi:uncharacterized membrane protein